MIDWTKITEQAIGNSPVLLSVAFLAWRVARVEKRIDTLVPQREADITREGLQKQINGLRDHI